MPSVPTYVIRSFTMKTNTSKKSMTNRIDAKMRIYRATGSTFVAQKIGKPRRGVAHWRTKRLLVQDPVIKIWYTRLWTEYKTDVVYELTNRVRGDFLFWLEKHIGSDARLVYDMVYDAYALDFENEEEKLKFILQWGHQ